MLPIVQFPRIVEQQAAWFDPVFTPDEQRKHFRGIISITRGSQELATPISGTTV
jgi:hypothetical protein